MARKHIDTNDVRDRLGEILDHAHYRGDEFIIQRRGKPLAAIVSYDAYEQLSRQRLEAFRVFHEIWDANKTADPAQVADDVRKAAVEAKRVRRAARPRLRR